MIVRGKMSLRTIIDYHAPFHQGFMLRSVLTVIVEWNAAVCCHSWCFLVWSWYCFEVWLHWCVIKSRSSSCSQVHMWLSSQMGTINYFVAKSSRRLYGITCKYKMCCIRKMRINNQNPVKMFWSRKKHRRSSRQQTPGPICLLEGS